MKIEDHKTIMVIALVSILLCACPGCLMLVPGTIVLVGSLGDAQNFNDLVNAVWTGFTRGGWSVCIGGLLILVPFFLASIAVMKKNDLDEIEPLEPTGISEQDPIPPTS